MRSSHAFVPVVAVMVIFLLFVGGQSAAADFTVVLRPERPVVGGFLLMELVPSKAGVRPLSVRVGKNEYPVWLDEGKWFTLVGFPLDTKPGRKITAVRYLEGGAEEVYPFMVEVAPKEYPAEYLKVPEKMVSFGPKILKRVLADQAAIRKACAKVSREAFWTPPFLLPVDSEVKSPFGLRRFFNGKPRSPHSGVDMKAALGTPVRAANGGMVALVRDCYLSGNTVVIDHGMGLFTLYAHLSSVKVRQGELVEKGQVIGLAGKSGRATGPHLHWGVSYLGKRLDPISLVRVTSR